MYMFLKLPALPKIFDDYIPGAEEYRRIDNKVLREISAKKLHLPGGGDHTGLIIPY